MSWRLAGLVLCAAVIVSAVALVGLRHETRQLFSRSQELAERRDALNVEWGMLQLEQAAWATHGRVDEIAREQLNMRMPEKTVLVLSK